MAKMDAIGQTRSLEPTLFDAAMLFVELFKNLLIVGVLATIWTFIIRYFVSLKWRNTGQNTTQRRLLFGMAVLGTALVFISSEWLTNSAGWSLFAILEFNVGFWYAMWYCFGRKRHEKTSLMEDGRDQRLEEL